MVGTVIVAGIAYRIAEENAENQITDLKRKLASFKTSSAAILTDVSLSTRIQSIEEYIDDIRGMTIKVIKLIYTDDVLGGYPKTRKLDSNQGFFSCPNPKK